MQAIRSLQMLARRAVNNTVRRQYHEAPKHRQPTQNDMPVPEGDFFVLHAKRQMRNNAVLATGLSMNLFGLYMLFYGNITHFHYSPPATYE